ncbi:rhodanese-like domain-containing protein [Streptomyces sp. WMMB 322]|uniref:rhodanese-like domain-containing protein n=1 Tax=Streptomyces sp. WMMB 322 TaxID=1286821 RepID=UPI0006E3D479|nr:rhodanese-like domain-containing protein [Streptomyces sp. WMMB 322]SCK58151.1 Rhodanese-related sulfurtransferase [Streptomyces sp. WMMB 322]
MTGVRQAAGDGTAPGSRPPSRVDSLLASARSGLERLSAESAARAQREQGALLVDIRYAALRERDGTIPGALIVERNELEWRLDPTCPHRSPEAFPSARGAWGDPKALGLRIVVVCNEGYASSLAARSLHDLGLRRATDLEGGFQSWRAAGLPVTPPDPPREDARPTLET